MIRAQHNPAAECVAQVDHACAAAEAEHLGKGHSHGEDENLRTKPQVAYMRTVREGNTGRKQDFAEL